MPRGNSPRRIEMMKEVIANKQFDLTVILENVHDTHNIGAVLRSCEAIGIQEVFLLYTEEHLYKKNLKLGKRTSSGARKWLDVYMYRDLNECVATVREKYPKLIGSIVNDSSSSLFDLNMTERAALVFGNEKEGISKELEAELDEKFIIPQFGFVKSLNISVACAVTLYEAARQRMKADGYPGEFDTSNEKQLSLLDNYKQRAQIKGYGKKPKRS